VHRDAPLPFERLFDVWSGCESAACEARYPAAPRRPRTVGPRPRRPMVGPGRGGRFRSHRPTAPTPSPLAAPRGCPARNWSSPCSRSTTSRSGGCSSPPNNPNGLHRSIVPARTGVGTTSASWTAASRSYPPKPAGRGERSRAARTARAYPLLAGVDPVRRCARRMGVSRGKVKASRSGCVHPAQASVAYPPTSAYRAVRNSRNLRSVCLGCCPNRRQR